MRNSYGMPHLLTILCLTALLTACQSENGGLDLAEGWQAEILAECGDDRPDMLALSADNRFLYQSCESNASMLSPSLARISLATGRRDILLYGLHRADGLKFAPDGSLWLGEEATDGHIWRIQKPATLPPGQRADRLRLVSSSRQVHPLPALGRFAHEGISFSTDGRFAYLADEWKKGCIYRFSFGTKRLQVMRASGGWLDIPVPSAARTEAGKLHGHIFNRIEDMEQLPDGRILMAETGTGHILALDDRGNLPQVSVYLKDARLGRPDNLEWDSSRGWLWITDDSDPSILWAWDGKRLHRIASHHDSEITGVESGPDGSIYIDLQDRMFRPDLTLRLTGSS